MANNILQIKRTTVAGRTPNTSGPANTQYINPGELALNLTDFKMFSSNGTAYFEVGANVAIQIANTIVVGNSTVNGSINATSFSGTSNNSLYLGGVLASGYQTTGGLASYAPLASPKFTGNVGIVNTAPVTNLQIGGNYGILSTTIASSNNISIYCNTANFFVATSNGSGSTTAIQFFNPPANTAYSFVLQLANATNAVIWVNAPKWPSATAPTASSNTDIYVFFTNDGGTTWRGNQVQKDSR